MNHNIFEPTRPVIAAPEEPEYMHIVADGRIKEFVVRWLLRRAPRALCGEYLYGDPDRIGPTPADPFCPACLEISGYDEAELTEHVEYVHSYWL